MRRESARKSGSLEIAAWGVMATPALVVDDQVVLAGRVPTEQVLTELLAAHS